MSYTMDCECGGRWLKIASASKIRVRNASEKECNEFAEDYWKLPTVPQCSETVWREFCNILNNLHRSPLLGDSMSTIGIRKKLLRNLGEYDEDAGYISRWNCTFVPEEDNGECCIQIETDYCHRAVKTGEKDEYKVKTTNCRYPEDFIKMLDVVYQILMEKLKLKKRPSEYAMKKQAVVKVRLKDGSIALKSRDRIELQLVNNGGKIGNNTEKLVRFVETYPDVILKLDEYTAEKGRIENLRQQFLQEEHQVLDVDGEIFFAYNNVCGFSLEEKARELLELRERCKEGERRETLQKKEWYKEAIIADFAQRDLLKEETLTNEEKIREYDRLREFCFDYMPQLRTKDFLESLCKKVQHGTFSHSEYSVFQRNWKEMNKCLYQLDKGRKGERKVAKYLKTYDDKIRILENVRLMVPNSETDSHEHDFIIISPYGVFTVEVKNRSGSKGGWLVLAKTGRLQRVAPDGSREDLENNDVVYQSEMHGQLLRRILEGCSVKEIPIKQILCSAEEPIQDEYRQLALCIPATLRTELLPENVEPVLSEMQMDTIEAYLLEKKLDAVRYPVFKTGHAADGMGELDSREAFIESFAGIVADLRVSEEAGKEARKEYLSWVL